MFIAMALPAVLPLKQVGRGINRKLLIIFLISASLSLVLLKCRTAWVGLIAGSIVYAADHFKIRNYFQKFRSVTKLLYIIALVLLGFVIAYVIYEIKKTSADSRISIWKACIEMIEHKPIAGVGYGLFERNYNIQQIDKLREQSFNADVPASSNYIKMAYNEFLQHAIEGGLIGCCLIVALFLSLLRVTLRKSRHHRIQI